MDTLRLPVRLAAVLVLPLLAGACAAPLLRCEGANAGPPTISAVEDLGGVRPTADNWKRVFSKSNGKVSPGEWLVIRGENLCGNLDVSLAGQKLEATRAPVGEGLLVKLPSVLPPTAEFPLRVDNGHGQAEHSLRGCTYLVVGDPTGGRVLFYPFPGEEVLWGDPHEMGVDNLVSSTLSRDGAFAFLTDGKTLTVIELPGKRGPKPIATRIPLRQEGVKELRYSPTTDTLSVLTEMQIYLWDVSAPGSPTLLSETPLAPKASAARYVAHEWSASGRHLFALDVARGFLTVVNALDGRLVVAAEEPVYPGGGEKTVVGMAADPSKPDAVWLLHGPNVGDIWQRCRKVFRLTALDKVASSWPKPQIASWEYVAGGELEQRESIGLPYGFWPVSLRSEGSDVITWGIQTLPEDGNVERDDGWFSSLLRFGRREVKNIVLPARILRVARSGETTTLAEAAGFFSSVCFLPGTQALFYAAIRPVGDWLPPFHEWKWVVESPQKQRMPLRELSMFSALSPPYDFPYVLPAIGATFPATL